MTVPTALQASATWCDEVPEGPRCALSSIYQADHCVCVRLVPPLPQPTAAYRSEVCAPGHWLDIGLQGSLAPQAA